MCQEKPNLNLSVTRGENSEQTNQIRTKIIYLCNKIEVSLAPPHKYQHKLQPTIYRKKNFSTRRKKYEKEEKRYRYG